GGACSFGHETGNSTSRSVGGPVDPCRTLAGIALRTARGEHTRCQRGSSMTVAHEKRTRREEIRKIFQLGGGHLHRRIENSRIASEPVREGKLPTEVCGLGALKNPSNTRCRCWLRSVAEGPSVDYFLSCQGRRHRAGMVRWWEKHTMST